MKAGASNGLNLEVVFYPKPGRNHHEIRAEFNVAIIDAASRVGVYLVPSQLHSNFPTTASEQTAVPDPTNNEPQDDHGQNDNLGRLDDLLPLDDGCSLRKRAGYEISSE
eukprot:COSAG02_NODE_1780_length_10949_cov_6.987281_2_plen_109_part_00